MARAIHRPGVNNELADFLSRNHLDPTKWHLLERVVLQRFQWWSTTHVDLLTSHLNHHFPLWFCWTDHPLVMALDALCQHGEGCHVMPSLPYRCSKKHW